MLLLREVKEGTCVQECILLQAPLASIFSRSEGIAPRATCKPIAVAACSACCRRPMALRCLLCLCTGSQPLEQKPRFLPSPASPRTAQPPRDSFYPSRLT
ncbi:hypothetical protein BV20DRAFT_572633 [Pilatotrama ljubarskyi]|nr:hypothetical protein BV20DRAFT_572633 [Pilatotrama ljubarskyi]